MCRASIEECCREPALVLNILEDSAGLSEGWQPHQVGLAQIARSARKMKRQQGRRW